MRKWNLRFGILLATFLPCFLTLSLIVGYYTWHQINQMNSAYLDKGQRAIEQLVPTTRLALAKRDFVLLNEVMRSTDADADILSSAIYDEKGNLISYKGFQNHPPSTMMLLMPQFNTQDERLFIKPIAQAFNTESKKNTIGYIILNYSKKPLLVARYQMLFTASFLWLAGLLLAILISYVLSFKIQKEILELIYFLRHTDENEIYKLKRKITFPEFKFISRKLLEWINNYHEIKNNFDQAIVEATYDLSSSLETLEIQNIELNLQLKDLRVKRSQQLHFLTELSYEVRAALDQILAISKKIESKHLEKNQNDIIKQMTNDIECLLKLIDDVLELSKVESGNIHFESMPIEMRECIDEIVTIATPYVHEKNIEFVCQISPTVPAILYGDQYRLKQIIKNFVLAAINFTQKGYVSLEVGYEEEKQSNEKKSFVTFVVTDTGFGFSAKEQEQIFTPYSQINHYLMKKQIISGFGLVISKKLIEKLGGTLQLESAAHQGTIIRFKIPTKKLLQYSENLIQYSHKIIFKNIFIIEKEKVLQEQWVLMFSNIECRPKFFDKLHEDLLKDCDKKTLLIYEVKSISEINDKIIKILRQLKVIGTILILSLKFNEKVSDFLKVDIFNEIIVRPISHKGFIKILVDLFHLQGQNQKSDLFLVEDQSQLKILIAEGNNLSQILFKRLFAFYNIDFTMVDNGLAALETTKNKNFDFIFLDYHLPKLNGFETAQEIRKTLANKNIPIILISTDYPELSLLDLENIGFNEFFIKPIEKKHLEILLKKYKVSPFNQLDVYRKTEINMPCQDYSPLLQDPELFKLFSQEMQQVLFEIHKATQEGNNELLKKTLHKFKGTCQFIHAKRLEEIVIDFETAVKNNLKETYEAYIADIEFERATFLKDFSVD